MAAESTARARSVAPQTLLMRPIFFFFFLVLEEPGVYIAESHIFT